MRNCRFASFRASKSPTYLQSYDRNCNVEISLCNTENTRCPRDQGQKKHSCGSLWQKRQRTKPLSACLKLCQVIPKGPNLQFWIWEDFRLYHSVYAPPFVTTTVLLEKKSFDITAVEWSSAFPYPTSD